MDDSDDVDLIQMITSIFISILLLIFFREELAMILNWILDSLNYIIA